MNIAAPREIGKTAMLLRGELTAHDTAAMIKMLLRANPKKYTHYGCTTYPSFDNTRQFLFVHRVVHA